MAELQTDAGAVIKVLAANLAAGEVLKPFFGCVALKLENEALQEQVAALLAMMASWEFRSPTPTGLGSEVGSRAPAQIGFKLPRRLR